VTEKKHRAPAWFTQAVSTPAEDRFVSVDGCRIHYLRRGQAAKPGLCFVHGGFAHAHWWDWIGPFFTDAFSVVALDLGGMGDSGHRANYSLDTFAEEVATVCAHAGLDDSPVVVGHSFGGLVALRTGARSGARIGGIVLVDFPIRPPAYEHERGQQRLTGRTKEIYPSLDAALDRFKLLPPQPCENAFIVDYIARRSLAEVTGGWSWKFDARIFDERDYGQPADDLARLACRVAAIYGERSALFPPEIRDYMAALLAGRSPMIAVPEAHHHLFLDQPLAFVVALRALLAAWIATPRVRVPRARSSQQPLPKPEPGMKDSVQS
jgi:pimeloyl-ACP methyl ester carboxylesterase